MLARTASGSENSSSEGPVGAVEPGRAASAAGRAAGRVCAAAPPPAATARCGRGRRERSTSGTVPPRNSAGRVYWGYSSSPAANDSSTADASLPMTPGTEPGHRFDHDERGGLAAGEHEVADRELTVAEMVGRPAGRPLRSGRTAARSRRRAARSRASAWSNRRPPAASRSSGRGGSTASTASKSGSGIITIPGPPPNGASSTLRCRSVAARPQIVHVARRAGPPPRPGRSTTASSGPRQILGEDGEDVDPHRRRQSQSPSGGIGTTTRPGSWATTNTSGRSRIAVEDQQIARRVGLERHDRAELVPARSPTVAPISSCDPEFAVAATSIAVGVAAVAPRSASAASRSSTPSKRTNHRC